MVGPDRGTAQALGGLADALAAGVLCWWLPSTIIRQSASCAAQTEATAAGSPAGAHVFIGYARPDQECLQSLVARRCGLDVWVYEEIPNGERWDRVIKQKIDTCAAVVVVMSPAVDHSHWAPRRCTEPA